jgi:hypothetical protein
MTAGVQVYDETRVPEAPSVATRRQIPWQPLTLAGVLCFSVSVNVWWVSTHLRGSPFDIDGAGYLQPSVRNAQMLHVQGLGARWSTLRWPDPQASLLTLTGGVVRWLTEAGTQGLLGRS